MSLQGGKIMNISYREGTFLALYLEFFNRCYDPTDERISGPEGEYQVPTRQMEMQNIIYIADCLGINYEDFGFTWQSWKGPYSHALREVLDELDQKYSDIDQFYMEYNRKRAENRSNSQSELADALYEEFAGKRVAEASFILEDILSREQGSDSLAKIVYIGRTRHPGSTLPTIMGSLNYSGCNINPEFAENIWKVLALAGLRRLDSKTFTKEKRLVSRNDGGVK